MDIYNLKRRLESAKENIEESSLSNKNKKLILEYCEERENGFYGKEVGKQRVLKLLTNCKHLALAFKKDMDKISETDLKNYLKKLNNNEDYSEWTRADYKKILKLWLKWLKDKHKLDIEFDFFSAGANKKKIVKLKREDFLSHEEVMKLIENANNLRDKCLIHMAWDLGARIGELANIKIKDILFDDEGGATINLKGKTGERSPYIIESIPTITQWLSIHPDKDNPNAPLFVGLGKSAKKFEHIGYRTFYKIFEKAMERSGLKRKFNPHLFRHSRALWSAQNNWNNQMANSFFGWGDNSNMFSYYVSLGSQDLKNHMKSMYGQVKETEKKQEFVKCKCGKSNDPKADFCYKCGSLLNHKKALQEDRIVLSRSDLKKQLKELREEILKEAKGQS